MLAGKDYDADPVTAVFTANQTLTSVEIPIAIDNEAEENEEFDLTIVIPSQAEGLVRPGARSNAVGIIQDSSGIVITQPDLTDITHTYFSSVCRVSEQDLSD